jgi:hypothetical protein
MAVTITEHREHNPKRFPSRGVAAKRGGVRVRGTRLKRRKNSALLGILGPVNPHGGSMKVKSKKKNGRSSSSTSRSARRKNPASSGAKTRGQRRRNPGLIRKGTDVLQAGFWVLIGLVLTRQIPQILLREKNTGAMGYLANIVTAIGAAWAASSVGGERAALMTGAGGGAYVITRAAQEHMNPFGRYLTLQGLGDAMALGEVYTGDRAYFPMPMSYDSNGTPIVPARIDPRLHAAPAIAAPQASSGLGWTRRMRRAA